MIPSIALQQALFSELSKGSYPVHEVVPSNTDKLPLITFGDFVRTNNFTKTNTNRFTYLIIVDGWSIGKSSIEIKQIEEFIYQTVMNLQMTDYRVELVNLEMNNNLKEEETADRIIFHSVQQFSITLAKKESN